jgi:hypothetical protein
MDTDLQDRLSDAWTHLSGLIQQAKDTGLGVQLIYGSGDPAKPPSTIAHEDLVGAELTFTKSF